MTNQEAIASLRTLCHNCKLFPKCSYEKPECFKAIELAISALHAKEAEERQCAAQKRRYTFGNDEFSLEDAYHDCKLVFDGITDDDSFQEADTGLVLYYANEIIYALHEALEGKDTNVPCKDSISRQAAIDAVNTALFPKINTAKDAEKALRALPSAQPKTGLWIENEKQIHVEKMYHCSECGFNAWGRYEKTKFCGECGVRMENAYEGSD